MACGARCVCATCRDDVTAATPPHSTATSSSQVSSGPELSPVPRMRAAVRPPQIAPTLGETRPPSSAPRRTRAHSEPAAAPRVISGDTGEAVTGSRSSRRATEGAPHARRDARSLRAAPRRAPGLANKVHAPSISAGFAGGGGGGGGGGGEKKSNDEKKGGEKSSEQGDAAPKKAPVPDHMPKQPHPQDPEEVRGKTAEKDCPCKCVCIPGPLLIPMPSTPSSTPAGLPSNQIPSSAVAAAVAAAIAGVIPMVVMPLDLVTLRPSVRMGVEPDGLMGAANLLRMVELAQPSGSAPPVPVGWDGTTPPFLPNDVTDGDPESGTGTADVIVAGEGFAGSGVPVSIADAPVDRSTRVVVGQDSTADLQHEFGGSSLSGPLNPVRVDVPGTMESNRLRLETTDALPATRPQHSSVRRSGRTGLMRPPQFSSSLRNSVLASRSSVLAEAQVPDTTGDRIMWAGPQLASGALTPPQMYARGS